MISNLEACKEDYGVDGGEWSNSIVSTKAVQAPNGLLAYPDADQPTASDATIAPVRALAEAAATATGGMEVGMGSEGGEVFEPYWIAASDDWSAQDLTADTIRSLFGGTLYANTTIETGPIAEDAPWWKQLHEQLTEDDDEEEAAYAEETVADWRKVIAWFSSQPAFVETAFVAIDPTEPRDDTTGGCVFPRILLGRLEHGSLAGLFGVVVYT